MIFFFFFANWKKPLKLTAASALLFSLYLPRMAPQRRPLRHPPRAAVQHCVYLTSWVRHSVCRVSVCQIPQVRHLLSNAAARQGDRLLPPTQVGALLSVFCSSSKTQRGIEQPMPSLLNAWLSSCAVRVPFHPSSGSTCWGTPPNGRSVQNWCWYSSSALWRQRTGPWLLLLCSQRQYCSLPQH